MVAVLFVLLGRCMAGASGLVRCATERGAQSRSGACRWLGVDHVFLFDNASSDRGAQVARLRAAFPGAWLTVRVELQQYGQLKSFAWCIEEQRANFNWLAFFDLDEYLLIRRAPGAAADARPDLKGVLGGYRCAVRCEAWGRAGARGGRVGRDGSHTRC